MLTQIGGFIGTVYIATRAILSDYLYFKFDSSLMKRLYYEEGEADVAQVGEATGM